MTRACWGSQSKSGRSQRRLLRSTLQFRRPQPGRVERLQRAEPGPSSGVDRSHCPSGRMAGPCGLRGTWWRSCGYGGAFITGRLKLRVRRLPKRRAEGRQPIGLGTRFVVDLEMGLNRPCLEPLTAPGTLRSAGPAAGPDERMPILTCPETMMYSRSPGSPWPNTVCPRGKSTR